MSANTRARASAYFAEDELPLRHYSRIITRSWTLIARISLAGLLLGVIAALVIPAPSTATTTVYASVITSNPFGTAANFDGATEVQITQSFSVASAAAEELQVPPSDVQDAVTASAVEDAQVLNISYSARTAEQAQAGADAVAAAYLAQRTATAQERVDLIVADIDEQSAQLQEQIDALAAEEANAAGGSAQALTAQGRRDALVAQLTSLASSRAGLVRIDTTGGTVLTPATENDVVRSPGRSIIAITGLAAGLLAGLIAVFAMNASSGQVRRSDDLEDTTGLRVLAEVDPDATADDDQVLTVREEVRAALSDRDAVVAVLDLSDAPDPDFAAALGQSLAAGGDDVEVLVAGDHEVDVATTVPVEHVGVDRFDQAAKGSGLRVLSAATGESMAAALSAHRVCDVAVVVVGDGTDLRGLREAADRFDDGSARVVGVVYRTAAAAASQQS